MKFRDLPLDVKKRIISYFDIDTRIYTGIIRKLKIPKEFEEKLKQLPKTKPKMINNYKKDSYNVHVNLNFRYTISLNFTKDEENNSICTTTTLEFNRYKPQSYKYEKTEKYNKYNTLMIKDSKLIIYDNNIMF